MAEITVKANTQSGQHITIASGYPTDPDFCATLAEWGISTPTPYGEVEYYTDTSYTTTRRINIMSQSEVDQMVNTATTVQFGPYSINSDSIKEVKLSSSVTSVPASFLCQKYTRLTKADLSEATLTSLPDYFVSYATALTQISLPSTVTTIGNYFLTEDSSLNSAINLENVTTVGSNFMRNCTAYDTDLSLPKVTSVGSYFCGHFASTKTIDLPELLTTGPYFFSYGEAAFDATINVPKLQTLGTYAFYHCSSYNKDLSFPAIVTIGSGFLNSGTSYNSTITLGSTLQSIESNFLAYCSSYNKPINLQSVKTIGSSFLWDCRAFNQNITLPSTITSIGGYFVGNCYAMTSTINVGSLAASVASSSNYSLSINVDSEPAYTTGIGITGSNKAAWISRFPNRTSNPYRKLRSV